MIGISYIEGVIILLMILSIVPLALFLYFVDEEEMDIKTALKTVVRLITNKEEKE